MEQAAWVQAGATIVLVLVTIWYAIETRRLVRQSAPQAWLQPIDILIDWHTMGIKIRNEGLGHAIEAKVYMIIIEQVGPIADDGRVPLEITECVLSGPETLAPGQAAEYLYESKRTLHAAAEMRFRFQYQNLSGKQEQHYWVWQQISSGEECWRHDSRGNYEAVKNGKRKLPLASRN